jgi:protein AaeX
MIEEIDLFGVYMPAALGWAAVAAALTALLRPVLRMPWLRRLVWQPGQLELACFFCLWWALAAFADTHVPHAMVLS